MSVLDKSVLDSKNSGDKDSVLYKESLNKSILEADDKLIEMESESNNDNTCGSEFSGDVKCTRSGSTYGPIYWGTIALSDFAKWNDLVLSNKITIDEKEILISMSLNEGKLDTVQSYDSEVISVGAMQKTLKLDGRGQLYTQLFQFSTESKEKYESLLVGCGWKVGNGRLTYKDKYGSELKDLIRNGFNKDNYGKAVVSKPLEPFIKACKDEDFQIKQIIDLRDDLRKTLQIAVTSYSHLVKDYFISKLGKATAFDQHINRPEWVKGDLGKALDNFFKVNPMVDKNPSTWGTNHSTYETSILEDYGNSRRGTDMPNRYKKLKNYFTP